jgi:hypothetical protein
VFLQRRRYLEAAVAFDPELLTRLDEKAAVRRFCARSWLKKSKNLDEQKNSLGHRQGGRSDAKQRKKDSLTSVRRDKEARLRALRGCVL